MKDNARHVPGSTESRRTSLSAWFPSFLASLASPVRPKSTYKMQSECSQNRECDFSNYSTSTTYSFNVLKCLHFLCRGASPLPWAAETKSLGRSNDPALGQGERQTATHQVHLNSDLCLVAFALKRSDLIAITVHNETK